MRSLYHVKQRSDSKATRNHFQKQKTAKLMAAVCKGYLFTAVPDCVLKTFILTSSTVQVSTIFNAPLLQQMKVVKALMTARHIPKVTGLIVGRVSRGTCVNIVFSWHGSGFARSSINDFLLLCLSFRND